MFVIVHRQRGR